MSKEVNVGQGADPAVVSGLSALPDPGEGKKLIVFISASSVRLRVVEDVATLEGQEPESQGGSPSPTG